MTLAEKIRSLREKNGYSISKLSRQVGIDRTSIYRWEEGITTPTLASLTLLAQFYGIDVRGLLEDDELIDLRLLVKNLEARVGKLERKEDGP
jgi:transcriptional regulator with XRE-family HTH domain